MNQFIFNGMKISQFLCIIYECLNYSMDFTWRFIFNHTNQLSAIPNKLINYNLITSKMLELDKRNALSPSKELDSFLLTVVGLYCV